MLAVSPLALKVGILVVYFSIHRIPAPKLHQNYSQGLDLETIATLGCPLVSSAGSDRLVLTPCFSHRRAS